VGTVTITLSAAANWSTTCRRADQIRGYVPSLAKDAIVAQVGLVYCFAGGYCPTLFSSSGSATVRMECHGPIHFGIDGRSGQVIHTLEKMSKPQVWL
jgi:hypothetical protein